VFDVAGRRVPCGIDRMLPSGVSELRLDTRGLAPGIYTARLSEAGRTAAVRLVLVR
jgi:hypothetical protein